MAEYEFELVFKLKDGEDPEQYLDDLFKAGCDDSGPGIGKAGYLGMSFCRESKSAFNAIRSAIKNVKKAIPHAKLESAGPWLLNSSELACEFGWTKQNMGKYLSGKSTLGEAPAPLIPGRASYWNVAVVAEWLHNGGATHLTSERLETYKQLWALNVAIEQAKTDTEGFSKMLKSA